jgi:hypothetical protein
MTAGQWDLVVIEDIVDIYTSWVRCVESPGREVAADPTFDQSFRGLDLSPT